MSTAALLQSVSKPWANRSCTIHDPDKLYASQTTRGRRTKHKPGIRHHLKKAGEELPPDSK